MASRAARLPLSDQFDLGLDRTRIKDVRDAQRQRLTAQTVLERFFHANPDRSFELQIVADEVGMGKTFVALAVAYSVMEAMVQGREPAELHGCYQKILIVTPQNSALFMKWRREVDEFVRRCIPPERQKQNCFAFAPELVERPDELVMALQRRNSATPVIVAHMAVFGAKFRDFDLKRRFLLGVLFNYWAAGLRVDARERLLKGAPENWPRDPYALADLTAEEQQKLPCTFAKASEIIGRLDRPDDKGRPSIIQKLLEACREISAPYTRNRAAEFEVVESDLNELYRHLVNELLNQALPLVIVDEAHNWKNGPLKGSNSYWRFVDLIGRRTRRLLLLTATPFQLRPSEILEVLKLGGELDPCPNGKDSKSRRARLEQHRQALEPTIHRAEAASRSFSKAWAALSRECTQEQLEHLWCSTELALARQELLQAASRGAGEKQVEQLIVTATASLDPSVRLFLREGLRLFHANQRLSHELGAVVIRHRRRTDHRLIRVGAEYVGDRSLLAARSDRQVLHAAPGLDVHGEGELPHYLLMRCVSEMKQGKGRSSLGSDLTGCYSTLLYSADGKKITQRLAASPRGQVYLELLRELVNEKHDATHPKLRVVIESVVQAWRDGEKTLLFCWRENTARRLQELIAERLRAELDAQRERCLGGMVAFRNLRKRLTGRESDLVGLGLDRILWSFLLVAPAEGSPTPDELLLKDEDLKVLAEQALRFGVPLDDSGRRVDRVFLFRATEHVIARRLLQGRWLEARWRQLLREVASDTWISHPYGLESSDEVEGEGESVGFDERGSNTVYEVREAQPSEERIARLEAELKSRREHARRTSLLDSYNESPSLWLGENPASMRSPAPAALLDIHRYLWKLSEGEQGFDWASRRAVLQALRRAVLRDSVLLRLLPDRADLEEQRWGPLLVRAFLAPLPSQTESMADRIAVFLEDLCSASGSFFVEGSQKNVLLEATRLKDLQFVALVKGGGDKVSRNRVFSGFNTPLLPEVLVCTSVGQEGIDLHRHCRHVVHYDLAWNPAVLEQRTGRVDRIGSKTFRERKVSQGRADFFLEVGVPFLAGTYDERMYEELRLRSQVFEVLTGGAITADNAEGDDELPEAEGKSLGLQLTALPPGMLEELRVQLHVWSDEAQALSVRGG